MVGSIKGPFIVYRNNNKENGTTKRKARVNIITPQGNKKQERKWRRKLRKKKGVRKKQQRVGKSMIAGMHQ